MPEAMVRVENLGKRYFLRHQTTHGYLTLRDSIAGAWRQMSGRSQAANREEFWALKGVSFEVAPGEVLGVVGRNGAGKSTLLKILSRITEPTEGRVILNGRAASLLEVGTGFHPELTGRENIQLNGAILGMTRAEIAAKFDEIVAFAEVERFLDTPVKHYSSGMYVRLAFAVAAHLEPEILIVDEVLAVGDAQFQAKCLGKMQEVASGQGRTVLFVSHNMGAVLRLCQKAIFLDQGQVQLHDRASAVTSKYLEIFRSRKGGREWQNPQTAPGDEVARLRAVRVLQNQVPVEVVDIRLPASVEIEYWCLKPQSRLMVAANFYNAEGVLLFMSADLQEVEWRGPRDPGLYRSRCEVPGNLLAEGWISIMAEVCTREPVWRSHVREQDAIVFHVVDHGEPGSVRSGWTRSIEGVVRPLLPWQTERLANQPSV